MSTFSGMSVFIDAPPSSRSDALAGLRAASSRSSSGSSTACLTGMLSNSSTYTQTLSDGQSLLDAKMVCSPSGVLTSRKSSAGDEYGKPRLTGADHSLFSKSQFET